MSKNEGAPSLRPYQLAALTKAGDHVEAGARAVVIQSATGSGKSVMAAEAARRHVSFGGSVLWVACREEIREQGENHLRSFGVLAEVTTVQTLHARRAQAHTRKPTLVILDECRHFLSGGAWQDMAASFGDAVLLGFDATPVLANGSGLGGLFQAIVPAATIGELTAAGYLAPLEIITPAKRLDPGELAQPPVTAYLQHAKGERAVVFAGSIEVARKIQDDFEAAGIRAGIVHGTLTTPQRKQVLAEHASGSRPVIVNVFCLTDGVDLPETSVCILARGCSSIGTFIQMTGRVLRPHASKKRALLLDLPGVCHVFGRPDQDLTYHLEGKGMRRPDGAPSFCAVCSALLPEDHEGACPECGAAPGGNPRKASKVIDVPLGDFIAAKCGDLDKRAKQLAYWIREGWGKGHKHGWATQSFKRETGFWPTKNMIDLATEMARGAA